MSLGLALASGLKGWRASKQDIKNDELHERQMKMNEYALSEAERNDTLGAATADARAEAELAELRAKPELTNLGLDSARRQSEREENVHDDQLTLDKTTIGNEQYNQDRIVRLAADAGLRSARAQAGAAESQARVQNATEKEQIAVAKNKKKISNYEAKIAAAETDEEKRVYAAKQIVSYAQLSKLGEMGKSAALKDINDDDNGVSNASDIVFEGDIVRVVDPAGNVLTDDTGMRMEFNMTEVQALAAQIADDDGDKGEALINGWKLKDASGVYRSVVDKSFRKEMEDFYTGIGKSKPPEAQINNLKSTAYTHASEAWSTGRVPTPEAAAAVGIQMALDEARFKEVGNNDFQPRGFDGILREYGYAQAPSAPESGNNEAAKRAQQMEFMQRLQVGDKDIDPNSIPKEIQQAARRGATQRLAHAVSDTVAIEFDPRTKSFNAIARQ